MIKHIFVGTPIRLMQGGVDVDEVVAGDKSFPGQVEEEVVVGFVSGWSGRRQDGRSGTSVSSEIGNKVHCHVGDVSENERKS
jgi:hypothetical protein